MTGKSKAEKPLRLKVFSAACAHIAHTEMPNAAGETDDRFGL
jgi:hypothetical protein